MSEPPVHAPAAVLIGETVDNMGSALVKGAELLKKGFVHRLILPSRESEKFGFAGVDYCLRSLESWGIDPDVIDVMEYDSRLGNINTMTEIVCYMEYAKQRRIPGAILVAAPFHQLRSFVTAATVALREFPTFNFYSCAGAPLEWNSEALHSQGTTRGYRVSLFRGEVNRIIKYQDPNNKPYPLVPIERVIEYMDRRNV